MSLDPPSRWDIIGLIRVSRRAAASFTQNSTFRYVPGTNNVIRPYAIQNAIQHVYGNAILTYFWGDLPSTLRSALDTWELGLADSRAGQYGTSVGHQRYDAIADFRNNIVGNVIGEWMRLNDVPITQLNDIIAFWDLQGIYHYVFETPYDPANPNGGGLSTGVASPYYGSGYGGDGLPPKSVLFGLLDQYYNEGGTPLWEGAAALREMQVPEDLRADDPRLIEASFTINAENFEQVLAQLEATIIEAERLAGLGNIIGSSIGAALMSDTGRAGELVGSTFFGAFGSNLAREIVLSGNLTLSTVGSALSSTLTPAGLGSAFAGAAIGTVSSMLTLELADALGLEGTAGGVFNAAAGGVVNRVLSNLATNQAPFASISLEGFWSTPSIEVSGDLNASVQGGAGAFAVTAIASYLGSRLGAAVVSPQTEAAARLSALGSAAGSWAFSSIGLSSLNGIFGQSWFALNAIAPGVGAFVGFVLGALIGNLFGSKKPKIPTADAETVLNFTTGYYEIGSVTSQNGGNEDLVRDMSRAARDTLNGLISTVVNDSSVAGNANYTSPTQIYGHTGGDLWVKLNSSSAPKQFFDSADGAVDYGALYAIRQTKITGGNLFMKRAISRSSADSIVSLAGDLQIAEDYEFYLQSRELINAAIAAPFESLSSSDQSFYRINSDRFTRVMVKDAVPLNTADTNWYNSNRSRVDRIIDDLSLSQFAAGWVITLQRAAELGLDQTTRSDFYGGLGGLVDSLRLLKGPDLYAEDISLVYSAGDLELNASGLVDGSGQWLSESLAPTTNSYSLGTGHVWTSEAITTQGGYNQMTGQPITPLTDQPSPALQSAIWQAVQQEYQGYSIVNMVYSLIAATGQDNTSGNDIYIHSGSTGVTIDDRHTETGAATFITAYGPGGYLELLDGGMTNVTLTFEGGDDIFVGGSGNDTLYGRLGYDWLAGGDGDDVIYGGSEDDVLLGGGGMDRLYGEDGDDYIAVGAGRDYNLSGVAYGAWGGNGNDTLVADLGNTYLRGENGDDLMILADGNALWSRYDGGAGNDTLSFERLSNGVTVDMNLRYGNDPNQSWRTTLTDQHYVNTENITGSEYNDTITGDDTNNILRGLGGDDILRGGAGADTLEGGAGADTLEGGSSSDTASYENSTGAVWLDFQQQEFFGGHAEGDTMTSIDRAIGSDFSDTFFDRNNWNTRFWGGRGDDWFVANWGSHNSDYFYGDEGFDTVDYADLSSGISINLGSNSHGGAAAGNRLYSIEQIVGTNHADTIIMDAKDNYIQGGKGNDTLYGGAGLDTYIYSKGDGNDTIYETENGGGYDTLVMLGMNWADITFQSITGSNGRQTWFHINVAGGGKVSLYRNQYHWEDVQAAVDALDLGGVGSVDIGRLNGGGQYSNGNDTVIGSTSKADMMMGYAGNDVLYGAGTATAVESNGNLFYGGRGNDSIYASVGDDEYIFDVGDGVDTIRDSGGDDRIQFGPDVLADDVIFEIVGNDLFIGLRDLSNPETKASQVADRMRIINANSNASARIEYIAAAGVDISLATLNIYGSSSGGGGSGGGGGGGGGGGWPPIIDDPWPPILPPGGQLPPVVFDLDGDGLELVGLNESRVVFQSDSGGPLMRLGWIGADEGILALDRDGNGLIDRTDEISFKGDYEGATTDLEGLRGFDTNGDGVFSATDDRWSEFKIWQDANQNGIGSGGELISLEEAGFASISLSLSPTGSDVDLAGDSTYTNTAVATLSDGSSLTAFDVALRFGLARADGSALPDASAWADFDLSAAGSLGIAYDPNGAPVDLMSSWDVASHGPAGAGWIDLSLHQDIFDELDAPVAASANADDPVTESFGFTPIVIDLEGDGFDLINPAQSPLQLDANGDGALDRMGWVGSGDGFLALDRNGSGTIEDLSEISFIGDSANAGSELEGLRAFDTNGDGWLSGADARFADFSVWVDRDFNALGTGDELMSLDAAGIEAIALDHIAGSGEEESLLTNRVFGATQILWAEGQSGGVAGDVELRAFRGYIDEQVIDERNRLLAEQRNNGFVFDRHARRAAMEDLAREQVNTDAGAETGGSSLLGAGLAGMASTGPDGLVSNNLGNVRDALSADGRKRPVMEPEAAAGALAAALNAEASDRPQGGLGNAGFGARWWADGDRAQASGPGQTLADRLAALDQERQNLGQPHAASAAPASGEELAEKQRLLQAIAAFRGSSGVATLRRGDEVATGQHDLFSSRRSLTHRTDGNNQTLYS